MCVSGKGKIKGMGWGFMGDGLNEYDSLRVVAGQIESMISMRERDFVSDCCCCDKCKVLTGVILQVSVSTLMLR